MIPINIMLPNFNSSKTIERAIESIKAQTYTKFVCNIVDDRSTDDSVEKVIKLIKNDTRFNLIALGKNKKIANARNVAAMVEKTTYLAALDSDDEWLKNHLSLRMEYMEKTNADFLYGQMKVIGDTLVVDKDDPTKLISIIDCSQGATIFIKSSVFWKLGGYRQMYGEDGDLLDRAIKEKFNIHKVDFETYLYYRNKNSLTDLEFKKRFLK